MQKDPVEFLCNIKILQKITGFLNTKYIASLKLIVSNPLRVIGKNYI